MSRAQKFLKDNGFDVEAIAPAELLRAFDREMSAGLKGRPASLPMIPSFIPIDQPAPAGCSVIVLDAGGTHLRAATVHFDASGRPAIGDLVRRAMPGSESAITAEAFYEALADLVEPLAGAAGELGFCFSYPADITPQCDARLVRWTKQIQAPTVVGTLLGSGLAARLDRRGLHLRVTVLNDTVATLLAGKSASRTRGYAAYAGFILGTGTNTAIVVRHERLRKIAGLPPSGSMAVNVESGSFALAPRSRFDDVFDATTSDPGSYPFEKMISGAYLGGIGLVMLKAAAREGLFSASAARGLLAWRTLANKELDDFCHDPARTDGPFAALTLNAEDRGLAVDLGTAVYARAARFAAINIAAAMIETANGCDPRRPVAMTIDGSTFYRTLTAGFGARIEAHVRGMLAPRGIECDLLNIEHAPIIGAAVAGLACRYRIQADGNRSGRS